MRISTETVAAIEVEIGRSVAVFDITHFVILDGDSGPSNAVTTCSVGFSGRQKVARAAR